MGEPAKFLNFKVQFEVSFIELPVNKGKPAFVFLTQDVGGNSFIAEQQLTKELIGRNQDFLSA